MSRWFTGFSNGAARLAGHYLTFTAALLLIVLWAVAGPLFGFSETWQLVVNTATTIITFLMVFLIQNTQNRDSMALHVKLDELIRALDATDDRLLAARRTRTRSRRNCGTSTSASASSIPEASVMGSMGWWNTELGLRFAPRRRRGCCIEGLPHQTRIARTE
jgi:low affinity Fe/Cu permease